MKLSIIIPTSNSAAVLGRALDSIVGQTFTDWDVLIMDNASEDDTIAIAQSYQDNRIKIFSEPDNGIYDAMNKGIIKSGAEWLYFMGSDDWLIDDGVLKFFFQDNDFSPYQVVYGEVEADGLDRNKGEWSFELLDCNRCHQAIFYRRSFFYRYGLYNLKYRVMADYDCNLKWFLNKDVRKLYVGRTVAHYSGGGFSSRNSDELMEKDEGWLIYRRGKSCLSYRQCRFWLESFRLRNQGDKVRGSVSSFLIYIYKIRIHMESLCHGKNK